jgi:hypothetical protein
MPDGLQVGAFLLAVAGAAFAFWQGLAASKSADIAKEQAAYAKEQAEAAKAQAAAAMVQADLARAELAKLKRAEDEEQAHQRWLDTELAELRKPGGLELVPVAPGDHLHAEWAIARGFVDLIQTSSGPAVMLPLAERLKRPGSPEAKMREARQAILTAFATDPLGNTSRIWQRDPNDPPAEWEAYVAAAQALDREGLAEAKVQINAITIRITSDGMAAARRGAF